MATLEPRVEPRAFEADGFEASFWASCEPVAPDVAAADYGAALHRLHVGMQTIAVPTPHFTERVADPTAIIAGAAALSDADRDSLRTMRRDP